MWREAWIGLIVWTGRRQTFEGDPRGGHVLPALRQKTAAQQTILFLHTLLHLGSLPLSTCPVMPRQHSWVPPRDVVFSWISGVQVQKESGAPWSTIPLGLGFPLICVWGHQIIYPQFWKWRYLKTWSWELHCSSRDSTRACKFEGRRWFSFHFWLGLK